MTNAASRVLTGVLAPADEVGNVFVGVFEAGPDDGVGDLLAEVTQSLQYHLDFIFSWIIRWIARHDDTPAEVRRPSR